MTKRHRLDPDNFTTLTELRAAKAEYAAERKARHSQCWQERKVKEDAYRAELEARGIKANGASTREAPFPCSVPLYQTEIPGLWRKSTQLPSSKLTWRSDCVIWVDLNWPTVKKGQDSYTLVDKQTCPPGIFPRPTYHKVDTYPDLSLWQAVANAVLKFGCNLGRPLAYIGQEIS